MRTPFHRIRHVQLLASIALLLLVQPFAEGRFAQPTLNLLLLVTLGSAVVTFAHRRVHLVIGLMLLALLQGAAWYRHHTETAGVSAAFSLLALVSFAYFAALVMGDVFRARQITADTICGALSSYLLLGICWAFAHGLLESLQPGSIVGLRPADAASGYDQLLFYSFITLTTVGYGNMVPANPRAETLAYAEAVVGQIFMTVLVARLVALNITAPDRRNE